PTMRFTVTLAAALALLAPVVVLAQSSASKSVSTTASAPDSSASASIAALTPCVLGCLTPAAADTCLTFTNVTCVCTNADFQQKAASCLQAECNAEEMKAALGLQKAQCGAASLSATSTPTATTPFLPSNSAADISASGVASGSGSGASAAATSPSAGILAVATPGLGLASLLTVVAALLGGAAVL
ncbi:hypothetical protein C8F01DRAFT_1166470, partial [Mycena amicta]